MPGLETPEPPPAVVEALQQVPLTREQLATDGGLLQDARTLDEVNTLLRRLWCEPMLIVNSIQAGDPPGSAGNVLVPEASARVGMRLPPGMDSAQVWELFCTTLEKRCSASVRLSFTSEAAALPWSCDPSHPAVIAMHESLSRGYGRAAVPVGNGATIPFVEELCRALAGDGDDPIPALLLPVEDPLSNAHGPNESVHLGDLWATCRALADFLAVMPK